MAEEHDLPSRRSRERALRSVDNDHILAFAEL